MEATPKRPGDQALGVLEGRGAETRSSRQLSVPLPAKPEAAEAAEALAVTVFAAFAFLSRHRSHDLPTNWRCRPSLAWQNAEAHQHTTFVLY